MKYLLVLVLSLLAVPAFSLNGNEILIDGPEVDLTVDELRKNLLGIPEEVRVQLLAQPNKLRDVMDSTYMAKVAAERARKKGLDKKPEVQARIWNHTQNILAEAELALVQAELIGKAADFEKAAHEMYLAQKERFKVSEQFKASHILLEVKEGQDEQAVFEQARKIRQEILDGRIDFKEAAKRYSKDTGSAAAGGSLGTFKRGRMIKPFEEALLKLKAGEMSEPVKTRFGYHLILLEEHVPARTKSFDEVKDALIKRTKAGAMNDIKIDYWLKVKNDPRAKVNEEAFEAFVAKPALLP